MPVINPQTGFDDIQLNGQRAFQNQQSKVDDFVYSGTATQAPNWVTTGTGTSQFNVANVANHPGILNCRSSGAGVNFTFIRTSEPVAALPSGFWQVSFIVQFPVLSDGVNRFFARLGLMSNGVTAAPVDGVFFEYSDAAPDNGNWTINNKAAGVVVPVDSLVPVVAGSWFELTIIGRDSNQAPEFFVNGASVGTVAVNIPAVNLFPSLQMHQTISTAQRQMFVDLGYWGYAFAAFR
jgi:hypothetical protein